MVYETDRECGPSGKIFHDRTYGKNFRYEDFVPMFKAELFDADKWADLFKKSGAKYLNFVSKHHDGYCLYKTPYAYNWNTADVGPHRDFLAEMKQSMEGTGVKFGVYHSVYEWFHPLYLKNPEETANTLKRLADGISRGHFSRMVNGITPAVSGIPRSFCSGFSMNLLSKIPSW